MLRAKGELYVQFLYGSDECTTMGIGIKVEDCDDRLNAVLKAACAMSPCTLPIR